MSYLNLFDVLPNLNYPFNSSVTIELKILRENDEKQINPHIPNNPPNTWKMEMEKGFVFRGYGLKNSCNFLLFSCF